VNKVNPADMSWINQSAFVVLILLIATSAPAQDLPEFSVSPSKATLRVGETRMFRAVGKDGRIRHNVRWSISPAGAASLTIRGDEAVVAGNEAASAVLTANAESDSAEATLEIRQGTLPVGTRMWTVDPIPGCKATKIIQAVPSANGPDLYAEEEYPQGAFIRALADDGRELWRRQISKTGALLPFAPAAPEQAAPAERLKPRAVSVCDAISIGMTKQEVGKMIRERNLPVDEKQRQGQDWFLEEEGFRCAISFDVKTETVVKKKKIVVTD
jgi:hypothetical protein